MCYEIDAWVTAVPMVFVGITTLTAAVLSIKNIFWPMAMKPGIHFQGERPKVQHCDSGQFCSSCELGGGIAARA